MALGNPNFGEAATTSLNEFVESGAFFQQITNQDPLFRKLDELGFVEDEEPGKQIQVNLIVNDNSTFKPYSRYELLDLTPQTGETAAVFDMKQYAGSVTIDGFSQWQNSGSARIVSILDGKTEQLMITSKKTLSADMHSDGTGSSGKQMTGLALAVEDGAAWSTYGGIDRSDSLNAFWRNQYIDVSSGGGVTDFLAVGQKFLRKMYNLVSFDNMLPSLIESDRATFEAQEASMVQNERWDLLKRDSKMLDAGIPNFVYKETPWVWSSAIEAGNILFLNAPSIRVKIAKGRKFKMEPFVKPVNQDMIAALLILYIQMISKNCRTNGRIVGFTNS